MPDGFEGRVIEDGSSPTVSFEWMLLVTTEDGIPPEGSKGLQYVVTVENGGSVVDTSTVDDPMNSTTFTGLPSCTNLTGILVATNGLLTSMETNTTVQVTESSECALWRMCIYTYSSSRIHAYCLYVCTCMHQNMNTCMQSILMLICTHI